MNLHFVSISTVVITLAVSFPIGRIDVLVQQCNTSTAIAISLYTAASSIIAYHLILSANLWPRNRRQSGQITAESAEASGNVDMMLEFMESKINPLLSPAENAINVLTSIVALPETSRESKFQLLYCIEVLSKRPEELFVPHGLLESNASNVDSDGDCNESVHEWLLSQFTEVIQKPESRSARLRRFSACSAGGVDEGSPGMESATAVDGSTSSSPISVENSDSAAGASNADSRRSGKVFGKGILFDCQAVVERGAAREEALAPLPFPTSAEESTRIMAALEGVDTWGWDVFKLREAAQERELQVLGWHLLVQWDLVRKLGLSAAAVQGWLRYVEGAYTQAEYHNATHAADVLQTMHFMLRSAGAAAYLSELEMFALLVAAMMHDVGHDGASNAFHKHLLSDRALAFNDQSIQENFHAWKIFSGMAADQNINLFQSLSREQFIEVRRLLIVMVLSTDMSKHFALHNEVKSMVEAQGRDPGGWSAPGDSLLCFLLHACDISAQCKPRHLALAWTSRCFAEFFRQGDLEKEHGLPVSPQCDRATTVVSSAQIGFVKFVVKPTYDLLGELLPKVAEICSPELDSNLEHWRQRLDRTTDLMSATKGTGDSESRPGGVKAQVMRRWTTFRGHTPNRVTISASSVNLLRPPPGPTQSLIMSLPPRRSESESMD